MNQLPMASTVTPTPTDQRTPTADTTTALFGRVADSIREHGATPAQAQAMTAISRLYTGSDTPTAVAARNLARIAGQRVKA